MTVGMNSRSLLAQMDYQVGDCCWITNLHATYSVTGVGLQECMSRGGRLWSAVMVGQIVSWRRDRLG